ncbi:MAG TPA: tripartite tricarboxylate transporter substrate-binding protein [Candidatus Eisenbacteria bacterium]|nr:tripartite tricarboxylate transporter substrate-binding protein [Candidatus Eisenbacteria bacterium]
MARWPSFVLVWLCFLAFTALARAAQPSGYDEKAVADFYRGKTVTIIVGHSAGGGFDRYARAIARHLGKYIPGNPAIVVNNMVGAGTMVSANYTYNQAPRDGTVINSFDGGLWPSQLYGSPAVQFDMTKFNYIGAPDIFKYIMVVTKQSGIAKMEEIMSGAKEVVIGAVPNTSIQHAATFLRDVMGGRVKLVTGFKGTAEIRLAMQSGEVNSVITGWETLGASNYKDFESGNWLILSQWVDEPLTDLPQKNVPSIYQFTRNNEEREMLRLGLVKPNSYARPYAMPPGVPPDRVRAVEAAFLKTLKDPEFVAEAEKTRMTLNPIPGTTLHKMIVEGLSMPERLKTKLKPILAPQL